MFKKTISYIGIYIILFNLFSGFLTISNVNADDTEKLSSLNNILTNIDKTNNYSKERLLVKFKSIQTPVNLKSLQSELNGIKLNKVDILDNIKMGVIGFDKSLNDIEKVKSDLSKMSNIEYVEYDYARNFAYTGVITNDTYSNEQWHLKSIKADESWKIYNDKENKTVISINDTGLDYTNPDLSSNLKDLSTNCKSDAGTIISGGCPNSGWNFEGSGAFNPNTSVFPENEIYDIDGHGTHVAGIIGAVGNNGTGVIGVTQNIEIMGARIETYNDYDGYFYVSNVIRALNFSIENGAKVVNASYGGGEYSQAEYDSIKVARDKGVLLIVAAGNEQTNNDLGFHSYPSDYDLDNIISVASVGGNDLLSSYSNFGALSVDVAAPGGDIGIQDTGILSTFPLKTTIYQNDLSSLSGTISLGLNPDWYLYSFNYGYHTQTPLYYTGGLDYSLVFDNSFSLDGANSAKLKGYLSCDFGSGLYDNDYGDYFGFYLIDTDTNNTTWLDVFYKDADGSIEIPLKDSSYLKGNLKLGINFVTDNDTDIGQGCLFDDLSIEKQSKNEHTYKYIQGTSMATPVVTGLASMIWSYKPELTYTEVKEIILSTVDLLPNLNGKVLTNGKINSKNALKELISRYGITKNGTFEGESFNTHYINLNGKNITLSGSTINITSTGTIMNLSGSTISGTGIINIGTGTNLNNSGSSFINSSENFDLFIKNSSGDILTNSGILNGDSLVLGYTGTQSGLDVKLYTSSGNILYNGTLNQNNLININSSFSGSLKANVYKNGNLYNGISTGILLNVVDKNILSNFTFNYVKTLTGQLNFLSGTITNNTGTLLELSSSKYPVNYELTGSIVGTQTGILNNSGTILLELTEGEGKKDLQVSFLDLLDNQVKSYTASIILDQTKPILNFLSHTNNQQVNSNTISLTGTLSDTNGISNLLINGNGINLVGNNFSSNINLLEGNNIITYNLTDNAGNLSTGSLNITRLVTTSNNSGLGSSNSISSVGGSSSIGSIGLIQTTTTTNNNNTNNNNSTNNNSTNNNSTNNNTSSEIKSNTISNTTNNDEKIEKVLPIKYLDKGLTFKTKSLEDIFNKIRIFSIEKDSELSNITYLGKDQEYNRDYFRTKYIKLVDSLKKLDNLFINKDLEGIKSEYKNYLSIYNELKDFKKDLQVSSISVNGSEVKYIKYENKTIKKFQESLFNMINKKQANTYIYRLANKASHNLNNLLTNNILTKIDKDIIIEDTKLIYKDFMTEYKRLNNK